MSDAPPGELGDSLELLLPRERGGECIGPDPAEAALAELYAEPAGADRWLRANFVASLDGAAVGADGLSGSLGGSADRRVFTLLRGLADALLVGNGTVRAEGYRALRPVPRFAPLRAARRQAPAPLLVVVSRSGVVPLSQGLFGGPTPTLVLTCRAAAGQLAVLAEHAGADNVLVHGEDAVDLGAGLEALAERGLTRVLCEGGPSLLGVLAASGRLDELCLTTSPLLLGGRGPRILAGPDLRLAALPEVLLRSGGTLLGRWLVAREG